MKKTKDIIFLCQYFYPEYVSSATLPYDTAKKFVEEGYDVGVLCGYPYEYNDCKVPLYETVNDIQIKRMKYLSFKRTSKIGRLINFFSFALKSMFNIGYFKNCKVIFVYSNPPLLPFVAEKAKERYGCKLVFVAYDIYPEIAERTGTIKHSSFIYKYFEKKNKSFFSNVDRVVALSTEMKDFIIENRNITADKVRVISNWYKDEFLDSPKLAYNGIASRFEGKIIISYLGNMGTCQDIDTILDVSKEMKDNKDYLFFFAGHGNKVDKIKESIANGAPNIVYYDFLHGQDYLDILQATSYAVVSLVKGCNGLAVPSKAYAYMMSNKSIICIMDRNSDIARDIIESNSGIVVNNGEVKRIVGYLLAEYISSSISDVYLQKYTPNVCLTKYSELGAELI